jgi:cell division protein FtsQ
VEAMRYNQPNTRERIAARRQARRGQANRPARGSAVRPNTGRRLVGWLASGRAVSMALFLASTAALAYVLTAGSFNVLRVEVVGNSALQTQRIIELSGLRGAPIWFVDRDAAIARLTENAYIESATVSVELPDLARISLTERRPDVRWQVGGIQYLVDSGGRVLAPADAPPEADVLVIIGSGTTLQAGDRIDIDALQLARSLALRLPNEIGLTPAVLGWDYGLGVYIKTASDQTIVFGRSEEIDRKLLILDHLLNKEATSFTYMDLRPANPFYQNSGAQPTAMP